MEQACDAVGGLLAAACWTPERIGCATGRWSTVAWAADTAADDEVGHWPVVTWADVAAGGCELT